LAKKHDPLDPTPWLYDAIQKQSQNRPIEALKDIQKSIELNGNRAIYRSNLLLDQDEASRSTSLARIYDNLGFEKRAIVETARSLSVDPGNYSAHRFLSDAYIRVPRHTAARASELLQAQLLQPININPVQSPLVVDDFNFMNQSGISTTGFNEFSPLMERNQFQLIASGIVGSNSTLGHEIVASGLYDRASVSIGKYNFQSDGFRENNDQKQNVYNAFIQYAVSPRLNLQTEIRSHETEVGDLLQDFNLDTYGSNRSSFKRDSVRVGAKYDISPRQDLILSGVFLNESRERYGQVLTDTTIIDTRFKDQFYKIEAQHLFRNKYINTVLGGGYYTFSAPGKFAEKFPDLLEQDPVYRKKPTTSADRKNIYFYNYINYFQNFNITLGLSYDDFTVAAETSDHAEKINPKFGVQWNIIDNLRLRAAWFETTKAHSPAKQTLEPTQVAGFNQLYDDSDGTRTSRLGIGLDYYWSQFFFAGAEASKRILYIPGIQFADQLEKQNEYLYRTYLYWTPHPYWVIKGEFQFERFARNPDAEAILFFDDAPVRMDTLSAPINIEFFHPSGIFSGLTGTFIQQDLTRKRDLSSNTPRNPKETNSGIDTFFLFDALLGYRLANRKGVLSLEARNLFNQHFFYRNYNLQRISIDNINFSPARTLIPERTFFARFTWNF